jgi:molybdopterin converting factor small subunit
MTIEVLFFAQLKEMLGQDREFLEVTEGKTVDDVMSSLRQRREWHGIASLPIVFAVNEEMVAGGHVLRDGERLALLTPLSGG